MVLAFTEVDVEADTENEAETVALQEDAEEWKISPRSHGMDYEIEWGEHESVTVNEVRVAPTRRVRA
jgi:hypothetical protein